MKILIIVNALSYGGAEMQAVIDANTLAQLGNHVTIAYNKNGALRQLLSDKVKHYHVRYKNVLLGTLQLFYHLLHNRYDIIHSHMFWAEKISALPGNLTGHKLIFNEHGLGLWRKWYHTTIMRSIALFAAKILTSCDVVKNVRVEREKICTEKVITVYNSYNNHVLRNRGLSSSKLSAAKDVFTIGFVGRFSKVKRLHIFIELANRLRGRIKNFRIILVGDGEEKQTIEKKIAKENLTKHFSLPGFQIDTPKYYKKFDVFVLPSKIEGFSLALLEAASFGIPTVAFDVGGNAEIIHNGKTGYVISGDDIEQLAEMMYSLYENNNKRIKMGLSAKEVVAKNFSVEKRMDKLLKIYASLE